MKVIFSHGKQSGPWGSKIKRLASTSEDLGFSVKSIDYSGIVSPDQRVDKLCEYLTDENESFVLVGSSMGGYVSLVAAEQFSSLGVFLLAPALYMEGYLRQDYKIGFSNLEIVHGWADDVVPVANSIIYAKRSACSLHLIDGDHRLNSSIENLDRLFKNYLISISKG